MALPQLLNHNQKLYNKVCFDASKRTTKAYSTSFSMGILCLSKSIRQPIYNLYGFVRFADEIVDTFHGEHQETMFREFKKETWLSIERKISTNPILHSFQETVNQNNIDHQLIEQFLHSMEMDLDDAQHYDQQKLDEYILGSAEVVGLMCLYVFCKGNKKRYEELKPYAMSLGSAFQKVNFLRDLQADYEGLNRAYFPGFNPDNFDVANKQAIEADILNDFNHAAIGIKKLPDEARFGVYLAFMYYKILLRKIQGVKPNKVMESRIRVSNRRKLALVGYSYVKHSIGQY